MPNPAKRPQSLSPLAFYLGNPGRHCRRATVAAVENVTLAFARGEMDAESLIRETFIR
jgi:hypothetical protein